MNEILKIMKGRISISGTDLKNFLLYFKGFFMSQWPLFWVSVFLIFLLTVINILREDGEEIFESQKGALVLEVYSRTDLSPEQTVLLEEELRSLSGIKEVVSTSPDESLRRITVETQLGIDPQWLLDKSEESKGKNTILPWSYNLHLERWDEPFLKLLLHNIENLEVGDPKVKVISEIHYDRERWSLTFALYNYVRWLWAVSIVIGLFFLGTFAFLLMKCYLWLQSGTPSALAVLKGEYPYKKLISGDGLSIIVFGILIGIVSNILSHLALSLSFFSETFSWKSQFGDLWGEQISFGILFSCLSYLFRQFSKESQNPEPISSLRKTNRESMNVPLVK